MPTTPQPHPFLAGLPNVDPPSTDDFVPDPPSLPVVTRPPSAVMVGPLSGPGKTSPPESDPASVIDEAMHMPPVQTCPVGQTAPVHVSTQDPPWQTWPDGHVTVAQSVSTHCPLSGPVVSHVWLAEHIVHGQVGTHMPAWQT